MIRLRHGIWHVTLNGRFFGDYRSEENVREGIADAAMRLTAPLEIKLSERDGI